MMRTIVVHPRMSVQAEGKELRSIPSKRRFGPAIPLAYYLKTSISHRLRNFSLVRACSLEWRDSHTQCSVLDWLGGFIFTSSYFTIAGKFTDCFQHTLIFNFC